MKQVHYWLLGTALVLGWLGAQTLVRSGTSMTGFVLDALTGFVTYAVIIYVGYGGYLLIRKILDSGKE